MSANQLNERFVKHKSFVYSQLDKNVIKSLHFVRFILTNNQRKINFTFSWNPTDSCREFQNKIFINETCYMISIIILHWISDYYLSQKQPLNSDQKLLTNPQFTTLLDNLLDIPLKWFIVFARFPSSIDRAFNWYLKELNDDSWSEIFRISPKFKCKFDGKNSQHLFSRQRANGN